MNIVYFGKSLQGEVVITVEAQGVAGHRSRGKRMINQVT